MSANLRLVPAKPAAIADAIDEVRLLVEVAGMATADLPSEGRAALRALLELIDDKLSALSETTLPGGGS